jgi:DNA (cytosine-5)-methyltransferase 1
MKADTKLSDVLPKLKVLNLYAGIGGNRKLWSGCEVTAVENVPEIAAVYQQFFPNDTVVVADAHQYLLDHFKEFDFIWSSPPCPTHSRTNNFLHAQGTIRYPDMKLWQEIVFLEKWFKGKYCVENVISYYPPLWPPRLLDRHYFWANFYIPDFKISAEKPNNICNARKSTRRPSKDDMAALEDYHGFKIDSSNKNRRILLRNCVYPGLGLHVLNAALNQRTTKQEVLL